MSREEENTQIKQASEYRRLNSLKNELAAFESKQSAPAPLLSVLAKDAGYGMDVESYEAALLNGKVARESLVTNNMGLVHFCVNDIIGKRRLNSLNKDDLIQEGVIGLSRAIDKYDPTAGAKLSTYAVYWIRAVVFRSIAERDDLLRVPEHVSDSVRKMTKAAKTLGVDLYNQEIATTFASSESLLELSSTSSAAAASAESSEVQIAKSLAEKAGLTDKQLSQAMKVKERRRQGGYTSFEPWMQTKDMGFADIEFGVVEPVTSDFTHLKNTLSSYVRPKELEALSWRYGLQTAPEDGTLKPFRDYLQEAEDELFGPKGILTPSATVPKKKPSAKKVVQGKWGEAMSFTEVGNQMSISAEYGRRLCHTALKKLQAAAEAGTLEPNFLM